MSGAPIASVYNAGFREWGFAASGKVRLEGDLMKQIEMCPVMQADSSALECPHLQATPIVTWSL